MIAPDPILRTLADLDPNLIRALERVCRGLRVPLHAWARVTPIRTLFSTLAVRLLEDDLLRSDEESTRTGARERACARLGVNVDTVKSRLREWR